MEMIEVDGLRITYERAGSGPPLVLLHGHVGDGPATWRPQLDGLGDDFTLYAWNAPGAGGSSDPPGTFGMAGYADALAGFIAALGLEAPHVAGISFGGTLALALYRRRPELPRTLVLASAYPGWAGSLPPEVADQRLRQAIALAGLSPDEFVGTLLPRGPPPTPSRRSVPPCAPSTRPASAPWPAPPPRTSATCSPASTSPPC